MSAGRVHWAAWAALALAWGMPKDAGAQPVAECMGGMPIAGTNAYRIARSAAASNAQAFGAVSNLERNVFPLLDVGQRASKNEEVAVMMLEGNFLWNVLQIPTYEPECPAHLRYGQRPLDLGATSLAAGMRFDMIGFFVAAGLTYTRLAGNDFVRYGMLPPAMLLSSPFVGIAAPVARLDYQEGVAALESDYIAGLSLDTRALDVRGGYVVSSGFYGHVNQPDSHAFLALLLGDGASELQYLRSGLRELASPAGLSTAFVRRLPFTAPSRDDLLSAVPTEEAEERLHFLTAHASQTSIAKLLDVHLAYAIKPDAMMHEARVGLHNASYRPTTPSNADEWKESKVMGKDALGYGATAGAARFPQQAYFGLDGRWRPSLRLEMTYTHTDWNEDDVMVFRFVWGFRYNEPDVLAVFPYAQDALDMYIGLQTWQ